jgi:kynureninase
MEYLNTIEFARQLDASDPLRRYRERFYFPQHEGKNVLYFCGNSLGLQPKSVKDYINIELEDWAKHGVEGHFQARNPWFSYHEMFLTPVSKLIGALPTEVALMNSLTTNLHLLMVSFYRPTDKRFKIICEDDAFPSDHYAIASQIKFHGYNPDDALIKLKPREGEFCLRSEDIIKEIYKHGDSLALVMLGGVNYYTGQALEMEPITFAGHLVGAMVGYDLAHATGNIKLSLHNWKVDFACWCTYKYLNSGPGGVSGIFVHEKFANDATLPRFAGWWGNDPATRFQMSKNFIPAIGASGWQLSNAPILAMAAHKASLDIFTEATMDSLIYKSKRLTGYLEFIIEEINKKYSIGIKLINIITPKDETQRGAQLSLIISKNGKELHKQLTDNGIISDWREPNVIRLAPVPLYNFYEDVFSFGKILESLV